MGQMRFYAPTPEKLPPHAIQRAYLAGIEAIPWQSSNQLVDHVLTLNREIDESGNLYIPWTIPQHGEVTLSTCSLMERAAPYHLPLELARGTLHRARNMATEMKNAGLRVSEPVEVQLKEALQLFVRASIDHATAEQPAEEAIRQAATAIQSLCQLCTDQILRLRHERNGPLSTMLGVRLPSTNLTDEHRNQVLETFNSAVLPFSWRQVQPQPGVFDWETLDQSVDWCKSNGLRVCGGPLIQLDHSVLPDWVTPSDEGYEQFENQAIQFIEEVVDRYRDDVHIWHFAGRLNVGGSKVLHEEHKLRLSVATVESVRRVSPRAPVVISFDQPWAEYLAGDDSELSPLHFADALVRGPGDRRSGPRNQSGLLARRHTSARLARDQPPHRSMEPVGYPADYLPPNAQLWRPRPSGDWPGPSDQARRGTRTDATVSREPDETAVSAIAFQDGRPWRGLERVDRRRAP